MTVCHWCAFLQCRPHGQLTCFILSKERGYLDAVCSEYLNQNETTAMEVASVAGGRVSAEDLELIAARIKDPVPF